MKEKYPKTGGTKNPIFKSDMVFFKKIITFSFQVEFGPALKTYAHYSGSTIKEKK